MSISGSGWHRSCLWSLLVRASRRIPAHDPRGFTDEDSGRSALPRQLPHRMTFREGLRSHAALHQIRYALRARIGAPAAFLSDRPPTVQSKVPASFMEKIREFGLEGAPHRFETALDLAQQLSRRTQHGRHLGTTSVEALRQVFSGPSGVCSDYAQVYLGLCTAAGIACREWGVSETLTGSGMGHTMSEIYCEHRGKWILIDAYRSTYVTNGDGTPLSVTEIVDRVGKRRRGPAQRSRDRCPCVQRAKRHLPRPLLRPAQPDVPAVALRSVRAGPRDRACRVAAAAAAARAHDRHGRLSEVRALHGIERTRRSEAPS